MQRIPLMDCGDGVRRADNGSYFNGPSAKAKTANYTIQANETGSAFTNTGASGEVDFTLPTAVAGLWFLFAVTANQVVKVVTSGGAKINNATTSLNAATPAVGVQMAKVICVDGTNWNAFTNGTFTLT